MSLKIDASMSAVAYHINDGEVNFHYALDAHHAVAHHPNEWSLTPWTSGGKKSAPMIPSDWQDMKPSERIALAIKLTNAEKGLTAVRADEMIAEEVEKRAAESSDGRQDETAAAVMSDRNPITLAEHA